MRNRRLLWSGGEFDIYPPIKTASGRIGMQPGPAPAEKGARAWVQQRNAGVGAGQPPQAPQAQIPAQEPPLGPSIS